MASMLPPMPAQTRAVAERFPTAWVATRIGSLWVGGVVLRVELLAPGFELVRLQEVVILGV